MLRFFKNRRKTKQGMGVPRTKEETGRNGKPLEPLPEEDAEEEETVEEDEERKPEFRQEDPECEDTGIAVSDSDSEVVCQGTDALQEPVTQAAGAGLGADGDGHPRRPPDTNMIPEEEDARGASDPLYAQVQPRRLLGESREIDEKDGGSWQPLLGAVGGVEEDPGEDHSRSESPSGTTASSEPDPEVVIPMERESDDEHITVRKMPYVPADNTDADDEYEPYPDRRYAPHLNGNGPLLPHNGQVSRGHPYRDPYDQYDTYLAPARGPRFQLRMDGQVVAYYPVTPTPTPTHIPTQGNGQVFWTANGVIPGNRALTGSYSPKTDLKVSFRDESSPTPRVVEVEGAGDGGQGSTGDEDYLSVGSEASDISESELRPPRLRVRRTLAIMLAWTCMGLYCEVTGPTLPYLMSRVDCTHETMARALASRGAGIVIGSLVGGLVCERFPHWLDSWLSSSLLLAALATAAAPWCTELLYLSLVLGTAGFAKALLVIGGLTQLMRLWEGTTLEVLVFLLHACYGLGAVPMVQLGKLFEASEYEVLQVNTTASSMASQLAYNNGHGSQNNGYLYGHGSARNGHSKNSTSFLDMIPRPMYPFDIAAVATFLNGAIFLMFFGSTLRNTPNISIPGKKQGEGEKKGFWATARLFKANATCSCRLVLWLLVLFCLPVGLEKFFGHYLYYYAEHSALGLPKEDSMLIQTIFWGCYCFGRLVTPLFARCVAPNGLLITCLTVNLVSTAVLCVYGEEYPIFLWIFSALIGTFLAPIFPGGVTWANVYLNQGALGMSLAVVAWGLADTLFSWSIGFLLEHFAIRILIYLVLACAGTCFLLYLPIIPRLTRKKVRISKRKRKSKHKKSKVAK